MPKLSKMIDTSSPNFFKFGLTGIVFAYYFRLNEVKCNQILKPYLHPHKNLKTNKIKGYAAKITTFFGLYVEYLSGGKITKIEFINLCLAGAITPIYDRFCDDASISKKALYKLTFTPSEFKSEDEYKEVYSQMLLHLRKQIKNSEHFTIECERVMNAQLHSRIQSEKIDIELIDQITLEKGGASFLFWASTLNRSFDEQEVKLFYQLGGFVQIIDDVFDIAQDLDQGIETLATKWISTIEKIELKLEECLHQNIEEVYALDISKKNKRKLKRLYYLLAVPAFIYLKRLRKESQKHSLITDRKTLKAKYIWTGWTPTYFMSMCFYLIRSK